MADEPLKTWKKIAIRAVFGGIGIAIAAAAIIGAVVWYSNRPTPERPWNAHAIVAKDYPSFSVGTWTAKDGKTTPVLQLDYSLENETSADYMLDSRVGLKFIGRTPDGTLTPDFLEDHSSDINTSYRDDVHLPIFIPAKQRAYLECQVGDNELPQKKADESASDYHERVRAYLEGRYTFKGFVIFDSDNRYEIDLPRWASKLPTPK